MYDFIYPINKSNNDCIGCSYYCFGRCNYINICLHKPMGHYINSATTDLSSFIMTNKSMILRR